jgi:transmembrane sensor
MTDTEEIQFADWITADPRHLTALQDAEAAWRKLDALGKLAAAPATPDPDFLAPAYPTPSPQRRSPWITWFPAGLAAAAALVFAVLNWPAASEQPFTEVATTSVGALRTLNLPDGSVIQLNTDSEVNVDYTPAERRVELLRGEAHFTVAKNPDRPFIVSANRVAVRAVGTAFNVRLEPSRVEVLVTEGKVAVNDKTSGETLLASTALKSVEPPVLFAGQRAVVSIDAQPEPIAIAALHEREIVRALSWQEKRLEFVSTPLSEVVAEFNRYNAHKLVIADPKLADLKFGGIFRPDAAETAVRMLETNFGVVAERRGSETLLRLADAQP